MSFNSFTFLVFLPVVFLFYWASSRNLKLQNLIVLVASYVFYGWWDWRFLFLMFATSLVDFYCGQRIHGATAVRERRFYLLVSIISNLGVLGFFKYCNFFIESFAGLCEVFGLRVHLPVLRIVLPVGISFYTFQALSYTIDIYRRKLIPSNEPVTFLAFISFFPQLVAGPIERAAHLLGQFSVPRRFDLEKAKDGLRQMLWGFFKKIVIADRLGLHVDAIFVNPSGLNSTDLLVGILFFSFQIYCDFSGYTDIAIGTARLFGFELMRNFNYPYFSKNIIEFWQRWHISLSSWFRDYVYISLGGNRQTPYHHKRNILVTFLLSGLWHGANWTFVYWGALNALYYIVTMTVIGKGRGERSGSGVLTFFQVLLTFTLVGIGWVFFRSANIYQAFVYFWGILQWNIHPLRPNQSFDLVLLAILVLVEFIQRNKAHGLQLQGVALWVRWVIYTFLIFAIMSLFVPSKQFIYFQF